MVKQTGAVGLVAVSVVTLIQVFRDRSGRRRSFVQLAWTWTGFAFGIACVLGVLAYRGTLGAAWQAVFVFNRDLLAGEAVTGAFRSMSRAWTALEPIQLVVWLAVLGLLVTILSKSDRRICAAAVIALFTWGSAQIFFALIGPSGSMRYWQAALSHC